RHEPGPRALIDADAPGRAEFELRCDEQRDAGDHEYGPGAVADTDSGATIGLRKRQRFGRERRDERLREQQYEQHHGCRIAQTLCPAAGAKQQDAVAAIAASLQPRRSEERRVGKEWGSLWAVELSTRQSAAA